MKVYDLIVIGSGLAGLSAAFSAVQKGLDVCVFNKASDLAESNTRYAQGGIVGEGIDDTPAKLISDIEAAGDHVNYREALKLIAAEGPALVENLLVNTMKVPFTRGKDGDLDRTIEAAHSTRRIFHADDRTGQAVITSFLDYLRKNTQIDFFPAHTAIDLITNTHNSTDYQEKYKPTRVIGVYTLDNQAGEVLPFFAPQVILAAGGVGNLFQHTTNPSIATGDGIAMAYRAGGEILNAEFVQFHPTLLFHRDIKRFLISESLRGEGARLVNRKGEYFMQRYAPELKDLAPRDTVARAIFKEMETSDSDYVFLDTSGMGNIDLAKRFPLIHQTCLDGGIDISHELIPVVPAAHYFCGGIKVNLDGQTHIPGLLAVGENACTGVHGANRLASVSLLEALYFGTRAGNKVSNEGLTLSPRICESVPLWKTPEVEYEFDPALIQNDLINVRITMWNYAGIIRTSKRLARAISDLDYMSHRIEKFYREAMITPQLIELRNAVMASLIIVRAASANKKSMGCHFRAD
ncbi:MAG: L-aspartate oxidase [Spirochaetales bacterium]|nr:L-aspartate oxidase [Spirochaetales bacterium]